MNVMTADIGTDKTPDTDCTPEQIALLAEEYRRAAHTLLAQGRRGEPLSRAAGVTLSAVTLHLK